MSLTAGSLRLDAKTVARVISRVTEQRPRVHCLTNTVAQNVTANMLLAFGAIPSMAVHADEVADVAAGAGAILINLGTISSEGERAIPKLLAVAREHGKPLVLDPVFVELSPLRMRLAADILRLPGIVVRGNAAEMQALAPLLASATGAIRVTTGAIDLIEAPSGRFEIAHGHRWMTKVTGLGCASSALVAACCAVEPDLGLAAGAALSAFGIAGEIAAGRSAGPGSFAMHLVDALASLDEATLLTRMG